MNQKVTRASPVLTCLQARSRSLQSLFGWLFGLGSFLLFSGLVCEPLKAVLMAGDGEAATAWRGLATMATAALSMLALLAALWSARAVFKAMAAGDVLSVAIIVTLDVMLARRKLRARDLAATIDISETNLSLLRSGKVKGIRFEMLEKLCAALDCKPGDLIDYAAEDAVNSGA